MSVKKRFGLIFGIVIFIFAASHIATIIQANRVDQIFNNFEIKIYQGYNKLEENISIAKEMVRLQKERQREWKAEKELAATEEMLGALLDANLQKIIRKDVEDARHTARNLLNSINYIGFILLLTGVIIGCGAIIILSGSIARLLRRISAAADQIKKGDLDSDINIGRGYDTENLLSSLKKIVEDLKRGRDAAQIIKSRDALITGIEKQKTKLRDEINTMQRKLVEQKELISGPKRKAAEIIDEYQRDREDLERLKIELKKARDQKESLSRELEDKVKERTARLSLLYNISNAISYTMDYQELLKLVMESLFKAVDFDIASAILFDDASADITLKPAYPESVKFVEKAKNDLIDYTSKVISEDIRKKHISTFLIPATLSQGIAKARDFKKVSSSFNEPFMVRGKIAGMLNVSSCREGIFDEDDLKLIRTVTKQASIAIERVQAAIKAETSKMESMVESMAEGVVMTDDQGEVVILNPQARFMLDFDHSEEITSKKLGDKMKQLDLDKALYECQDRDTLTVREIILPKAKSQIVRSDMSPVKDVKGNTIGIVTILRDITREKEIDRMKTEFITTVSHELRTPLSITKEGISLVLDKILGEINEKQDRILKTAKGNIDRLARIIDDLLDISKIEAGKVELKRELVSMTEIMQRIVSAFEKKAEGRGLKIKLRLPKEIIKIYADSDKITQVFTNLIGNAMKFTERGHIELALLDRDEKIECTIVDTGRGISKEDLPRLFAKFQQFGRTAGGGEKGTGLGLSIARAIVHMHKGEIWAESTIGKGTKFIFTLPKYTPEKFFIEHVDDAIAQAKKGKTKMSLISISTNKDQMSHLSSIEGIINKTLRRTGDITVRDTGDIVVLLVDCDSKGASVVRDRLRMALTAYNVRYNLATYPDDGLSAEDLIKKTRRR